MSRVLAVTGLTGKKSGGAFAKLLQVNFNSVAETFDEIGALVTKFLTAPLHHRNCAGLLSKAEPRTGHRQIGEQNGFRFHFGESV